MDKDEKLEENPPQHGHLSDRIKQYFDEDIWCQDKASNRFVRSISNAFRKICVATKLFFQKDLLYYAASLAFNTVLSIVPLVAIVLAVSRGFGYSDMTENLLRWVLSSQQDVADYIIRFANSYLNHALSSTFIGFGIIVMLYSVISLIDNVETVFDGIWNVKDSRDISRKIINYLSMFFMVPITIIIISGVNIAIYAYFIKANSYTLLAPILKFLIQLIPIVVMTVVFVIINVSVPNTKVHIRSAIIPSLLTALFMVILQQAYMIGQRFLTGYNAVYGSLAALPLFMIWIQLSWYIILYFAELSYIFQNQDYLEMRIGKDDLSYEDRLITSSVLLSMIYKRFKQGAPHYTAKKLHEESHLPLRLIIELLDDLCAVKLLDQKIDKKYSFPTYYPYVDISSVNLGTMVEKLSRHYKDKKRLEISEYTDNHILERIMKSRDEFLASLNQIDVSEISKCEGQKTNKQQ